MLGWFLHKTSKIDKNPLLNHSFFEKLKSKNTHSRAENTQNDVFSKNTHSWALIVSNHFFGEKMMYLCQQKFSESIHKVSFTLYCFCISKSDCSSPQSRTVLALFTQSRTVLALLTQSRTVLPLLTQSRTVLQKSNSCPYVLKKSSPRTCVLNKSNSRTYVLKKSRLCPCVL